MEIEEKGYNVTSTQHTEVSFKTVPLKLRLKILFGKDIWITTKATIQVKQELEPVVTGNGIDILINENKPKDGK